MKIKVLGPGCARCQQLEKAAQEAVKELGAEASIELVKDMKKIMEYPILMTPGLVINEELVCSGRVPNKAEVTQFIINAQIKKESSYKEQ